MSNQLASLPAEVVELIASRAESADLLSLRLVCRLLRAISIYCFSRTFFSIVRSDLSIASLEKLKSISEHEQLKLHVQALLISGSDHPDEERTVLGRGFHWPRSPSGQLITPMPCLELLRTILLNGLINCRSFLIYRSDNHEDEYLVDWVEGSDAAAIIFTIIAETALPVKSFRLDFTEYGTPMTLDWKRVHIPEVSGSQNSSFSSGWSHLEALFLGLTLSVESVSLLTGLVLSASHLQNLEVGPDFDNDEYPSDAFFEPLSAADRLPAFRELSLCGVSVTEPTLTRFILCFGPSLCRLLLDNVMITSPNSWAEFFRAMKGNFPLLEHISVQELREELLPENYIFFPLLGKDSEIPETGGRKFDLKYTIYHSFGGPFRVYQNHTLNSQMYLAGHRMCGLWDKSHHSHRSISGAEYSGPGVDMALEMLAGSAIGR